MHSVVVLNASYEPLGIVPLRRALVFLVRERAVIVDAVPGAILRSAAAEMPVPRVVQFRDMVRVPFGRIELPWTRGGVLQRDRHSCAYCGRHATTIDHVLPRSRGGANTWSNTVAACVRCNGQKADRTPDEAGMPLRTLPAIVTRRDTLVVAMVELGVNPAEWGLVPQRIGAID